MMARTANMRAMMMKAWVAGTHEPGNKKTVAWSNRVTRGFVKVWVGLDACWVDIIEKGWFCFASKGRGRVFQADRVSFILD